MGGFKRWGGDGTGEALHGGGEIFEGLGWTIGLCGNDAGDFGANDFRGHAGQRQPACGFGHIGLRSQPSPAVPGQTGNRVKPHRAEQSLPECVGRRCLWLGSAALGLGIGRDVQIERRGPAQRGWLGLSENGCRLDQLVVRKPPDKLPA